MLSLPFGSQKFRLMKAGLPLHPKDLAQSVHRHLQPSRASVASDPRSPLMESLNGCYQKYIHKAMPKYEPRGNDSMHE